MIRNHIESLHRLHVRVRLWAKDARCYWCRRETRVLTRNVKGKRLPDDAATIEHVFAKGDDRRTRARRSPIVLACHACNRDRGNATPETWRVTLADRYYAACEHVDVIARGAA